MCFYLFAPLCNFKKCSHGPGKQLEEGKDGRRQTRTWKDQRLRRMAVVSFCHGLFPCQDEARVLDCLILQSGHNKYLTLHKSLKSCQKQQQLVSSAYAVYPCVLEPGFWLLVAVGWILEPFWSLNGFATFRRSTFMLMTLPLQLEAAVAAAAAQI